MAKNNESQVSAIVAIVLIIITSFVIYLIVTSGNKASATHTIGTNVTEEDGKQIVGILAKGGYSPAVVYAKANVDTILRVSTQNTFDCSTSLVIPELNYRSNLPSNGSTDVVVGPRTPGSKLAGTCSMGMYKFTVIFQ